jgi:hypothetical protein
VHERGKLLDLDVLRDVLVYEVFHDTQLGLGETRTRFALIGVVSVPEREMKCEYVGERGEAHRVRASADMQRGERDGRFTQERVPRCEPAWDIARRGAERLSSGFPQFGQIERHDKAARIVVTVELDASPRRHDRDERRTDAYMPTGARAAADGARMRGGPVRRDDTHDPLCRLYGTIRAGRADRMAAKTLHV